MVTMRMTRDQASSIHFGACLRQADTSRMLSYAFTGYGIDDGARMASVAWWVREYVLATQCARIAFDVLAAP